MGIADYSEEEFEFIKKKNMRFLSRGKTPVTQPKAYLLGGQSGAGKSSLHGLLAKEQSRNIIIIDGDTFRAQHPNAQLITNKFGVEDVHYTAKFAGEMVEALVKALSEQGYNLIIEGTLRTVETPKNTATDLKSKGYDVELVVMAVKPTISYLSTLARYEQMYQKNPITARATPKEHHDLIVQNLPNNLEILSNEQIFSNIRLFDRNSDVVYDQNASNNINAKQALEEFWENPYLESELEMFEDVLLETQRLVELRKNIDRFDVLKELIQLSKLLEETQKTV
ncbi:MAG: zeta toxin family protein [Streptococcaceae bacterium]|jgi:UDP-N-acetylglucosamine kinase|nr:zeta toxin family protein [Streptococcaceae bacterium]